MTHKCYVERIYHLTCSSCENWWSYAHEDRLYDLKLPSVLSVMCCPHCGEKNSVERSDM